MSRAIPPLVRGNDRELSRQRPLPSIEIRAPTLWGLPVSRTGANSDLNHGADYTSCEGMGVTGWPVATVLRVGSPSDTVSCRSPPVGTIFTADELRHSLRPAATATMPALQGHRPREGVDATPAAGLETAERFQCLHRAFGRMTAARCHSQPRGKPPAVPYPHQRTGQPRHAGGPHPKSVPPQISAAACTILANNFIDGPPLPRHGSAISFLSGDEFRNFVALWARGAVYPVMLG